jgi:TetR/AcrR family transcriptional regulator of autoinduction and epiphytic fitness
MSAPQRLTDRKRLAIIDAAIAEFRASGFEATSMDKIAATAGVSKRTVYNHFPGKNELFAEILGRLWDSSTAQMNIPYRAGEPLLPQLQELLGQKLQSLAEAHFLDLARVAIAEAIHSPQRAQEMVARVNNRDTGLPAWIRAAQADGTLKPVDPLFAAHLLEAPLKSFAFWPQVTLGQPPLERSVADEVIAAASGMFLLYYAT